MENEILHMINLDTIGGVEELFVHFLKESATHPHRHHILVTGGKIHPHFQKIVSEYAASVTYEKYFLRLKLPKLLRALKRTFALKNKSHIILWNRFDKIKPANPSTKVIYYEHGASWIAPQSSGTSSFFDGIDVLLAASKAAKRILELKWGITKPISVVENPLRPDLRFAQNPRTTPHSPFRIGYIGRLIPLKGVALLISAVRLLTERQVPCELFIAGDGQEKEKLETIAKGLPITFYGAINDVTTFYDSIDLLVVPSIREPLGLVALEAEARGVPVIATCIDGLPESVHGYLLPPTLDISRYPEFGGTLEKLPDTVYDPLHNALAPPRLLDPRHIAECIEELITNPAEYQKLSKEALHFASCRTNFTQYAEKLLTFIS